MTQRLSRRRYALAAVIAGAAVLGLALSLFKSADNVVGFSARHPLSPTTWIVIGLAAVITVRLTQRQPARWLIPLASGAAFFGAATVAGSDGLPTVRAHVPLRTYADGDRQTLTVAGLERFGLRARRIEKAQERMADICTGGSETACETAMRSGVLPAIEDYRKSLVEVVEPLAPGSKCVAALDAHSRALAAFAATTREFMAAELDRDVDRAQELEQGQAARTIMAMDAVGAADFDRCLPSELR